MGGAEKAGGRWLFSLSGASPYCCLLLVLRCGRLLDGFGVPAVIGGGPGRRVEGTMFLRRKINCKWRTNNKKKLNRN